MLFNKTFEFVGHFSPSCVEENASKCQNVAK